MKYRYLVVIALATMVLAGCSNNTTAEHSTEQHKDSFIKLVKEDTEDNSVDSEESTPDAEDNTSESGEGTIRNPDDFRLDSEERIPEGKMKDILVSNEAYITEKGLSLESLINSEWEYRSSEDLYSLVAFDGSNFHAVIVSVNDNTIVIDPQ